MSLVLDVPSTSLNVKVSALALVSLRWMVSMFVTLLAMALYARFAVELHTSVSVPSPPFTEVKAVSLMMIRSLSDPAFITVAPPRPSSVFTAAVPVNVPVPLR